MGLSRRVRYLDELNLESWRYKRVVQVLKDYEHFDHIIQAVEESIRVPYKQDDAASDRRGTKVVSETQTEVLYRVETDKRIVFYRKAQRAVKELLNECDTDTKTIINELYIPRYPKYTLDGLVQKNILSCGRNKAIDKRKQFFKYLDAMLD